MVQNVLDSVPLLKNAGQIRKSEFLDSGIHPSKEMKMVKFHEHTNMTH